MLTCIVVSPGRRRRAEAEEELSITFGAKATVVVGAVVGLMVDEDVLATGAAAVGGAGSDRLLPLFEGRPPRELGFGCCSLCCVDG